MLSMPIYVQSLFYSETNSILCDKKSELVNELIERIMKEKDASYIFLEFKAYERTHEE